MTHTTGPRKAVVSALTIGMDSLRVRLKATTSEFLEAAHDMHMALHRATEKDEDCPTCPKPKGRR